MDFGFWEKLGQSCAGRADFDIHEFVKKHGKINSTYKLFLETLRSIVLSGIGELVAANFYLAGN